MTKSYLVRCAVLWLTLLLGGCGSTNVMPTPTKPVVMTQLMAAQCRVFERAFKATQAQGGGKVYSVVEDCPGYRNVKPVSSSFAQAGLFFGAATSAMPPHVKASGAHGKRLYQQMLARGVSAKIAGQVAKSPEFKVAVNVAKF